jgi:hypothetical protein
MEIIDFKKRIEEQRGFYTESFSMIPDPDVKQKINFLTQIVIKIEEYEEALASEDRARQYDAELEQKEIG